jgi:hypothetical protein
MESRNRYCMRLYVSAAGARLGLLGHEFGDPAPAPVIEALRGLSAPDAFILNLLKKLIVLEVTSLFMPRDESPQINLFKLRSLPTVPSTKHLDPQQPPISLHPKHAPIQKGTDMVVSPITSLKAALHSKPLPAPSTVRALAKLQLAEGYQIENCGTGFG